MADFVLPRVKVCGVRSASDLGAVPDAVGIVLWGRSPRAVDGADARSLAESLTRALPPGVLLVAVMVDAVPADVPDWADAVQLCGGEAPEPWQGFPIPILRRLPATLGAESVVEAWRGIAAGFVLDHPRAPGGSGETVDLAVATRLARLAPCLLAGGLNETNVGERVRVVRPEGVDASSRLESAPGRKDPARIAAFVKAARAALEEIRA
jgi:phosphoribosylanthranilate isomerase